MQEHEQNHSNSNSTKPTLISCQGCGKPTGQDLCCPQCVKLGRTSFFCSQQCFAQNWPTHAELHKLIQQQQEIARQARIQKENAELRIKQMSNSQSPTAPPSSSSNNPISSTTSPTFQSSLSPSSSAAASGSVGVVDSNNNLTSNTITSKSTDFSLPAPHQSSQPIYTKKPYQRVKLNEIPLHSSSSVTPKSTKSTSTSSNSSTIIKSPIFSLIQTLLQDKRKIYLWLFLATVFLFFTVISPKMKQKSASYSITTSLTGPKSQIYKSDTGQRHLYDVSKIGQKLERITNELSNIQSYIQRHEELIEIIGKETGLKEKFVSLSEEIENNMNDNNNHNHNNNNNNNNNNIIGNDKEEDIPQQLSMIGKEDEKISSNEGTHSNPRHVGKQKENIDTMQT